MGGWKTEFFDENRINSIESAKPEEVKAREKEDEVKKPVQMPKDFFKNIRKSKNKPSTDTDNDFWFL